MLNIEEISFSDSKILAFKIDLVGNIISFNSINAYNLHSNKYVNIAVEISDWETIDIDRDVSDQALCGGSKGIEGFELIQEHEINNSILILSGFGNVSKNWIKMIIKHPSIIINAI